MSGEEKLIVAMKPKLSEHSTNVLEHVACSGVMLLVAVM